MFMFIFMYCLDLLGNRPFLLECDPEMIKSKMAVENYPNKEIPLMLTRCREYWLQRDIQNKMFYRKKKGFYVMQKCVSSRQMYPRFKQIQIDNFYLLLEF